MYKFVQSNLSDISSLPGSIVKEMLAEVEKDLFLITPEGILFFEGSAAPVEAYYKVEIESKHSILLEIQATKGGNKSTMRISMHESNLLLSYPADDTNSPPKYFLPAQEVNQEQKQRLNGKPLNLPYMNSIEKSISSLVGE